ncbi:MAG: hypothetical protein L7F78_27055 [Syntrophales bacterium LBB04]|nr:hypothetical protein [Syntrophales bacterium LBB04]
MYRIKPKGRYQHKCEGCGVYIKAEHLLCYGCICDVLDGVTAGTWRKQEKPKERTRTYALTTA